MVTKIAPTNYNYITINVIELERTHTGLGMRKPENKFQKLRKKELTIAAI